MRSACAAMPSRSPLRHMAKVALGVAACGVSVFTFVSPLPLRERPQVGNTTRASAPPQSSNPLSASTFAFSSLALVGLCAASASRAQAKDARKAVVKAEPDGAVAEDSAAPPAPEFDPAAQPGVTLPLMYFDPAGFCKVGDSETFYSYRCAELKHGRVAMMAALGAVMQHWLKFPGFNEVPSGIKAVITPPGTFGLVALFALSGGLELTVFQQDPEKEPGNFGDPFGVGQYYEEWRNRELNNGRFAMIAIMGIIVAELVTGKDGVDQIFTPLSNLEVE